MTTGNRKKHVDSLQPRNEAFDSPAARPALEGALRVVGYHDAGVRVHAASVVAKAAVVRLRTSRRDSETCCRTHCYIAVAVRIRQTSGPARSAAA